MNKFDTPLLPTWLDGGLQGAVLVAATTLVLACWLTGEPLDKTGKLRAAEAAEAAERTLANSFTLPPVLVVARADGFLPVTTALASASRTDCAAGSPAANLHQ
ncbi:hypothetical protein LZ009_12075 [Ramlibacter sp. XY19]|uniref:hypothetical protein n=1 Tax=Ramlibacter paludis TaxID=2908000 RepID=UPI0023D9A6CC|nr:hypothetical protein [Ramlibacter paludis]MCG2593514.1 hypothetical protein [Ramlibacter paludis]